MKRNIGIVCLLLAMFVSCAAAQTLPSNACFSPGLVRLAQMEAALPPVSAQATVSIDKAMYARDLSVLRAMLDGATIGYRFSGGEAGEESLAIARNGETLGVYALPKSEALDALTERLLGVAVLERVPLDRIAAWLEGLRAGDALALGYGVAEPFAVERTMSDDGTRLTKIVISGAIARAGEAPVRVEGFLRQPAGRAPKDTFELTFTQDEDNAIELLYSALRENEITRRNKEGTASVRTTLKAAGKLGGYGMSSRLNVTMKNRWTADGEALSERITITASLTHTDSTPGRRMQRLNEVEATAKHALRLTTHEAGDEAIELSDAIELEITMDSNAFLAGTADVTMRVGGAATVSEATPGEAMDDAAAKALARKIYRQLGEGTKETIHDGL